MSATIVEAVTKLATKVKGETVVPKNATVSAALDALADALAGENVQAKPTIASAIDVITENYTPGGGGVTLGNACMVSVYSSADDDFVQAFHLAKIDGITKAGATAFELIVAAGFDMDIDFYSATEPTVTATVTKPDQTTEEFIDFTVSPDQASVGDYHITFTVPNLPVDDTDPSDVGIIYSTLVFTF